jgi:tRNA (guanine-N7-)-methyltransferase
MRSKIEKFRAIESYPNVVERGKEIFSKIKGNWSKLFFKNDKPITLELACGRGEYSVALAALFPERNFIGVDIKGERIWKGSTQALERGLENVAFLRIQILYILDYFEKHEVDEIWITFPDPRPRKRDIKRRLTSPRYLAFYKEILRPGGIIRLKTDNTQLFEYTLETIMEREDIDNLAHTADLYHSELRPECFDVRTRYEEQFSALGHDIKYLRFSFKSYMEHHAPFV